MLEPQCHYCRTRPRYKGVGQCANICRAYTDSGKNPTKDYTALKTDLKAAGSSCNSAYIQALTHKINAVETALNAFCDEERKIIHERLFDKKRFADTTAAMPDRKKSRIVQAFIHSVGCYLGEF